MEGHDQKLIQIYSSVVESQRRYTYLLLAVAASAIALTLKNTENEYLNWLLSPAGAAIILWSLSFYKGTRYLKLAIAVMSLNMDLLDFEKKNPPTAKSVNERRVINIKNEDESKKAEANSTWQFRFLLLGAISYIVWHLLRLYVNTFCLTN